MTGKRRRLLVLPAGWEQVPLIRAAKARGHWVVAADQDPAAEGRTFADASETASPRDLCAVLALAKRHRVDAVATDACDYSVYAAAYLAESLGIPGPSLDAAARGMNKRLQREAAQAAGIRQPAFAACRTLEEGREALRRVGLPAVVKPVDNRGAFGVTVVAGREQFAEAFLEALAHSYSREAIVERYIEGTVLTVEGMGLGRSHKALTLSSKTMLPGRKRIALQLVYPAELPKAVRREALAFHEAVADACAFRWGPTHGEYILDQRGRLHLVEIGNRGSGVLISPLAVPPLSGMDTVGAILDLAEGRRPAAARARPAKDRAVVVILGFLIFPPGVPKRFAGLAEAARLPGVLAIRVWAKTAQPLPPAVNALTRHGFILARGRDKAAALAAAEAARRKVSAVYADGSWAHAQDPALPRAQEALC